MIRIDIVRSDGEVTRLEGASGIAVCSVDLDEADVKNSQAGMVSVRCSNLAELSWNLATILAAVDAIDPIIIPSAIELMQYIDAREPAAYRELPDHNEEDEK